ncbi:MAG: UDP-2,3-diacylglucosamine diphosphatase LpxI [Candidatus Omnitrophica bacterium]|nr:UDP-2,3-diacylglucosamine diphosphatase LpxI [Candidatus Omnitrophota bacterium]
MEKIGLIAGNRKFPLCFAEAARKEGYLITAVAIKGDTSRELESFVDEIHWLGLENFSRMFDIFKAAGVTKVAMAGQISPRRLFSRQIQQDVRLRELLLGLTDKRADTIFKAIAEMLEKSGFQLLDSTIFLKDYLPQKGTLTLQQPDFKVWEDVYFALTLAKEIASLDIGQTVAVKDKAIVAVEALEGTDNLIRRAGYITKDKAVIVKVSKPNQDLRFDIPVVGFNTVKNLVKIRASCLAIEAGKTLFIDRQASVRLADRNGLSIVAV